MTIFGYETIGASLEAISEDSDEHISASLFKSGVAGTLDNIKVALRCASGTRTADILVGMWKHSDLSLVSSSDIENITLTTTPTYYTFTSVSGDPVLASTDYLLGVEADYIDQKIYVSYDTGDTDQRHKDDHTWTGSLPNPFVVGLHGTIKYSIYATYTPTGGAGGEAVGSFQGLARDLTLTLPTPFSKRFPKFKPRILI